MSSAVRAIEESPHTTHTHASQLHNLRTKPGSRRIDKSSAQLQATVGNLAIQRAVRKDVMGAITSFSPPVNVAQSEPERVSRHGVDATASKSGYKGQLGVPQREAAHSSLDRDAPHIVYEALRSPGRPLDAFVRASMEPGFRQDFSQVRIHSDERASAAATSLHAAAFTLGSDIVFGANRYVPGSPQGQLLIRHELRHVAQQRSATPVSSPEMDSPHSMHEREARRILDPHIEPLPKQRIQCAPEDAQFSLGGGLVDTLGIQAFGDNAWPFIKAVFEGFFGGLQADVKSGRAEAAKSHLSKFLVPWNAINFNAGFLAGFGIGLVSPITDLVKGIIGVVKLSISALEWLAKWSLVGVAVSPDRSQKIVRATQKFVELSIEFDKALIDFASDPQGSIKKFAGFLDHLMQMALGKAHEFGAKAAHSIFDYLEKDFFDMGRGIGEVIGALIAQVLLLVFSDAIGNLISKGASFLGKAAEFVAGKAGEVFEWVKGLVSEVISLLRNAVKGALKLFEGLANKAVEAFDALAALVTESEALEAGGERIAAGVGRGISGPTSPNLMESRMVKVTRENPIKTSELYSSKVHPSNLGEDSTERAASKAGEELHSQAQKGVEAAREMEGTYINGLKERYPKLKDVDIRPKARPSAGRFEGAPESAFEERMQTTQGKYSLAVYDKGKPLIEFDGISVDGWIEEIKIEQQFTKIDDILAQLRRQVDFAEAYGLKGVRYSIESQLVADEVEARVAAERLRNVFRQ